MRACPALRTFVAILLSCLSVRAFAAAPIEYHRIIGPEIKTGDYKHPSCFDQLDNGDLYLAYYGGAGEYADETKVYGLRLSGGSYADGNNWTAPQPIAQQPFLSLGNPVIWQAPDGILWFFYVTRYGDTWSSSRIAGKISRDHGHTWSDSFMVTFEEGTMVRGQPILLRNGDYLLPIYHETGADPEVTGADSTSRFLRKRVGSNTWEPSGILASDKGNLQPAVAQIDDKRLVAFCRRAGDYEPTTRGWIVRGESNDGGFTWSRGVDTEFPNPNSAVDLKRLSNGHLLLVYNDSMVDRTPLTVAISTDGGQTFPHRRNIAEGPGAFAYPTAIQTKDQRIHIVYTSDNRTTIRHAILTEDAITSPN
ncbi:MAG: exo-alpha-sialidase [Planctomycetales bacterium]|nr:exo-alpha-sialidase [Planctomycetales bacterium]